LLAWELEDKSEFEQKLLLFQLRHELNKRFAKLE
jgi:hypothetical protein